MAIFDIIPIMCYDNALLVLQFNTLPSKGARNFTRADRLKNSETKAQKEPNMPSIRVYLKGISNNQPFMSQRTYSNDGPGLPGNCYIDLDILQFLPNALFDQTLPDQLQADPHVVAFSIRTALGSFFKKNPTLNQICMTNGELTVVSDCGSYLILSKNLRAALNFYHWANGILEPGELPEVFTTSINAKKKLTATPSALDFAKEFLAGFRLIGQDIWRWILLKNKEKELWTKSICSDLNDVTSLRGVEFMDGKQLDANCSCGHQATTEAVFNKIKVASCDNDNCIMKAAHEVKLFGDPNGKQLAKNLTIEKLEDLFIGHPVAITHVESVSNDQQGIVERIDLVHSGRGHYFEFKLDSGYFFSISPSTIGAGFILGIIPRASGLRKIELMA